MKQELRGGVEDLVNYLCVYQIRNLLLGTLYIYRIYHIQYAMVHVYLLNHKEGRRLNILCVGLGFSRQLRTQWLSMYSPIELAFFNINHLQLWYCSHLMTLRIPH